MILTGNKIIEEVLAKKIVIEPFTKKQINPNSYDFRLSNKIIKYKNNVLDPKIQQETIEIEIPEEGYILEPNTIYLGSTREIMGSNHFVPIIRAKSSIARMGLFIHITADLIDIGSINQFTLQLHAVQKVKIFPNMLIGQVTFWETLGEITLYEGKYKGLNGPQPSQIYKDFEVKN